MNLNNLPRRAAQLVTENSPVILTALGVAGVATTAWLTHKAAYKGGRMIMYMEETRQSGEESPLTKREKFDLIWKVYIPAAGAGVMTATCVILANRIGTRRAAVVVSALTLSERAFEEYREHLSESLGAKGEEVFRSEVNKKKLEKIQPTEQTIIVTGKGKTWLMEAYTNRVFEGDKETVRRAENDMNKQILEEDYATLSDFYDRIGLDHTSISDDFGWNTSDRLVLDWSAVEHEGVPVLVFDYGVRPFLRPYNLI
jgi:hypothetical protein